MSFETISLYVIEEVFHLQGINATDSIKMEKREESSSDTDNECSENHDWIWEKLVIISCYNDRWSSLDLFKTYIRFHINSLNNRLFQSIMEDVTDADKHEISLQKAVRLAVERNGESITEAVNSCSENEDYMFWCRLAELSGDLDCKWLTGEPCHCIEHKGMSMLDTTSVFVKLFIDIEKDDLIEEIESDVEDKNTKMFLSEAIDDTSIEMPLIDVIDQVVMGRKEEILLALREARKTVDVCGIWNRNIFFQ